MKNKQGANTMKKLELYHGTNNDFEEFGNDFLSTSDSIDQYGSGFYFYDTPSKTCLHGDIRVVASVEINKLLTYKTINKKRIPVKIIERLLLAAPGFNEKLENFGEVDFEGFNKVFKEAVSSYKNIDILECLNCIGNDFYEGDETYILLSKYAELTGYNALYVEERDIYVVFTKKQIEIIRKELD